MLKSCFTYSNCVCCTKTATCITYLKYKNQLSKDKTMFKTQVNNPGIKLFN